MAMVRAKKNIVSLVRELKPRKDTSRIEVMILRLWRNYNKESGNTIEMVVVDKEVSNFKYAFFWKHRLYNYSAYIKTSYFLSRGQEFMLQLVNNSSKNSMTSYAREMRLSSSCSKCTMLLVIIGQTLTRTKLGSSTRLLLQNQMIFQVKFPKNIWLITLKLLMEKLITAVWLVSNFHLGIVHALIIYISF